jgi:enoyl-CoA hydratase/carnithine racemase
MFRHIEVTDEGPFRVITMQRERSRNSLSEDHLAELDRALADAATSTARGVIIAARGPVFSSGHDFADMAGRDLAAMTRLLDLCATVMLRIPALPQPVIAQVEGLATAAGCQLVASCDLAVAGASTAFQLPGGRGGWGCTTPAVAVSRAVGRKRALELLLTGEPIDAPTALAWGLVNRVVPDGEVPAATRELLSLATRGSVAAKGVAKRAFHVQVDLPLPAAYQYATQVMASSSQTASAKEGVAAFLEKRRPEFD